jgi:hypothetical protein
MALLRRRTAIMFRGISLGVKFVKRKVLLLETKKTVKTQYFENVIHMPFCMCNGCVEYITLLKHGQV